MPKTPADRARLHLFEASSLPLHGIAVDYPKGHVIPAHIHAHSAQLLYAVSGVLLVQTRTARWLVPPNRAVWLSPQEEHTVVMRSQARVRSLFIKPYALNEETMKGSRVTPITPLLKELILAVTLLPIDYQQDRRAQLLVSLLLEELTHHASANLLLPWPDDARYQQVCEYVVNHLSEPCSIAQLASACHMSIKTFERQFVQCTGMPFGKWRQKARLLYSLEALSEGSSITHIALEFGYGSHSAYSAAFKAFFGQSPSAFMKEGIAK